MLFDQIRSAVSEYHPLTAFVTDSERRENRRNYATLLAHSVTYTETTPEEFTAVAAESVLEGLHKHAVMAMQMNGDTRHPTPNFLPAFESVNAQFARILPNETIADEIDAAMESVLADQVSTDHFYGENAAALETWQDATNMAPAEEGFFDIFKKKEVYERIIKEAKKIVYKNEAEMEPQFELTRDGDLRIVICSVIPGSAAPDVSKLIPLLKDLADRYNCSLTGPLPDDNGQPVVHFFMVPVRQYTDLVASPVDINLSKLKNPDQKELYTMIEAFRKGRIGAAPMRIDPYSVTKFKTPLAIYPQLLKDINRWVNEMKRDSEFKAIIDRVCTYETQYAGNKDVTFIANDELEAGFVLKPNDLMDMLVPHKDPNVDIKDGIAMINTAAYPHPAYEERIRKFYQFVLSIICNYVAVAYKEYLTTNTVMTNKEGWITGWQFHVPTITPAEEGFFSDMMRNKARVRNLNDLIASKSEEPAMIDGVAVRVITPELAPEDEVMVVDKMNVSLMEKAIRYTDDVLMSLCTRFFQLATDGMELKKDLDDGGFHDPYQMMDNVTRKEVCFTVHTKDNVVNRTYFAADYIFAFQGFRPNKIFRMSNWIDPKTGRVQSDRRIACSYTEEIAT